MFRERARTLQDLSLLSDVACLFTAFGVAVTLRVFHSSLPVLGAIPAADWTPGTFVRAEYAVLFGISVATWVGCLRAANTYGSTRSESFWSVAIVYARTLALAGLAAVAATFFLKMDSISRVFFLYYFSAALVLLLAKQLLVIGVLRKLRMDGMHRRHALVIGTGKPASWFAKVLMDARETGYDLVGLLLTRKILSSETLDVPVIGTLEDLDDALRDHPVDEVFIVGGAKEIAELAPTAERLIEKGRVVSLITPLSGGTHGVRGRITEFSGVPMISFGPMPHDEVGAGLKRVMDVAVAGVAIILLSPVMAAVAVMMKMLDPGPVLFSQQRLGKGGKRFVLHKFRSMRCDAEQVLR